ncbi:hypothetical protein ACO0QE_004239 [Hanseniaspora vineae]
MLSVMNRNTPRVYPANTATPSSNKDSNDKRGSGSNNLIEDRKHKYSKYERLHGVTATNAHLLKKQTILGEMRRRYKDMKTLEIRNKMKRNNVMVGSVDDQSGEQLTTKSSTPGNTDNTPSWYDAFVSDDDHDENTEIAFTRMKDEKKEQEKEYSPHMNYDYINKMSAKYQISVEEAELYYSQMLNEESQEEEQYLKDQENKLKKEQLELQLQDLEEQEQMDIEYLLENFKIE